MLAAPSSSAASFDIVLVGGGLANSLIALAVLERRPDLSLALVENQATLGGNHTWSFHPSDVGQRARSFVEPLVEHRWPAYSVAFPGFERRLEHEYACFSSERLDSVVRVAFSNARSSKLVLEKRAVGIGEHQVVLDDGTVLRAHLVIDGRGPERLGYTQGCRFQKFVGLELTLASASPVREPMLMDARVSQADGFRFVYVLPFDERRVLIEDTYFADTPELDDAMLEERALRYAGEQGFRIEGIVRRERGILPLPLETPMPGARRGPLLSGYHGGWFHPTTGYSFPAAVRLAEVIAGQSPKAPLDGTFDALLSDLGRQQRYFTLLNRLLYGAFAPEQRFNVLQRFYALPCDTIRRFYAMRTTTADRARILCGRPPRGLSIKRALFQASTI